MERYFAAKARLFAAGPVGLGRGQRRRRARPAADGRRLDPDGRVRSRRCRRRRRHCDEPLVHAGAASAIDVPIGGEFNVMNSLAAATAVPRLGHRCRTSSPTGSHDARPVPGRFEPVVAGQPFAVIVDYAHTPDGLREALGRGTSAAAGDGSVHVVFGCGGDRDRDKRPLMGAAARRAGRSRRRSRRTTRGPRTRWRSSMPRLRG